MADGGGLDLLLELLEEEGVPESPVREAEIGVLGYCSDEERPRASQPVSMAAFKAVVGSRPLPQSVPEAGVDGVEKHSGLRIKEQVVSPAELSNRFAELRFLRLQGIKSAMMRESIRGAWATIGIVVDKGSPKVSSAGKNFVVWKLGTLDGTQVSLFLFGEAYANHWKTAAGSIVAVFNAKVRQEQPRDFSLSVFSRAHLMKVGTARDYGVCKGRRKDGTCCTTVIDRRHGEHCRQHATEAFRKFKTVRAELRGGKITDPFCGRNKMLCPVPSDPDDNDPANKPAKYLSSTDLKKFLSDSDKVSATGCAQGKRLLAFMSEKPDENQHKDLRRWKKERKDSLPQQPRTPLAHKDVNCAAPEQVKVMELDVENSDDSAVPSLPFFLKAAAIHL